jgi:hypothetical protein
MVGALLVSDRPPHGLGPTARSAIDGPRPKPRPWPTQRFSRAQWVRAWTVAATRCIERPVSARMSSDLSNHIRCARRSHEPLTMRPQTEAAPAAKRMHHEGQTLPPGLQPHHRQRSLPQRLNCPHPLAHARDCGQSRRRPIH